MNSDIKTLNESLYDIDKELISLITKRIELSHQLNETTDDEGLNVPLAQIERDAISNASNIASEDLASGIEAVYRTMMSTQQIYNNQKNGVKSATYENIQKALQATPQLFPERATVACQGVAGAYSQSACEGLFKSPSIMYCNTFEAVFKAVESGLCKYGVLPIENSTAGSVNAIYDAMISHNFSIVKSIRIRVNHCLVAKPGTKIEDIKEIVSHEQALSQCKKYISTLNGVKTKEVANTAMAAKMVSQSERTDLAAIASSNCSDYYDLKELATEIQDNNNNYTRFICITKNNEVYPGADRISFMMTLPHKPGALYKVISRLNALGINMRKLESRPLQGREFEFMFYFDVEASIYSPDVEKMLTDLEQDTESFRYLGAYSEILA